MKTIVILVLSLVGCTSLLAQFELASASGVAPQALASELPEAASSEPSFSAYSHTVDDVALIRLGRGIRTPVRLQVLSPTTAVLVNREIPSGQTLLRVDLAGFPDGVYTVRVQSGDKTWVKQIVKGD